MRKIKIKIVIAVFGAILYAGCAGVEYSKKEDLQEKDISENNIEYKYFFVEGIKQKMLGNLGQAKGYFEKAISLSEKSSAAYYELSNIYALTGNYKKATEFAKKAKIQDEENIWYKLHLANVYLVKREIDSTINIYENIYENNPERGDLAFKLSGLYKQKGEKEKALKIYEELEKRVGISKQIGLAKEEIYEENDDYEKAKKELDKLLKIYENDVNIIGILAELYHKNGYDKKTEETYKKIFKIDPGNYHGKISLLGYYRSKKKYNKVFELLGEIIGNDEIGVTEKVEMMLSFVSNRDELKNYTTNIEMNLEKLEKKYPDEHKVKAVAADFYLRTGRLPEAKKKLKYIIDKEKGNYVMWEQLLLIENSMGNYSGLYEESSRAIEIYNEQPTFYLLNGIAANELKKYNEAVESLKSGLKYIENDKELRLQFFTLLGDAYRSIGIFEKSDEYMEKALEVDPENIIVLNNYAYYLSLRGTKLRKALRMSRKCIDEEPENATYLDTYGWILFKMGKIKKAKIYLEKAMRNAEIKDAEITDHYGDLLFEMEEYEKAVETWENAIILGGEKVSIEKKISKAKVKENK